MEAIYQVGYVGLNMVLVNIERTDAGCLFDGRIVVDGHLLKAADLFTLFADDGEELHIHLNAIGPRMFFVAPCVDFAQSRSMWHQTNAVTPQDTRSPRASR